MFEFQVSGMTCGGCASRVKRAVQTVDPQAEVNIDLKSKRIRVHANADADAIKTVVSEAGYPVAEVDPA